MAMMREVDLEYNEQVSMDYRNKHEYQQFVAWCEKSDIRVSGVEFPAFYGENGQLRGARASEDILPFQAIIAVPQRCLMMSRKAYDDADLSPIFARHPVLFDPHVDDSASYNAVMFFMIRERLKNRESDIYHVWNIVPIEETYPWVQDDMVEFIKDQCLLDEINCGREKLDYLWNLAKPVFDQNPQIFTKPITRQEFNWSYYFANSRCFGEDMPSLIYSPVIDLINHKNKDSIFHCSFAKLSLESMTTTEAQKLSYDKHLGVTNLTKVFPKQKHLHKVQVKSEAVELVEVIDNYVDQNNIGERV